MGRWADPDKRRYQLRGLNEMHRECIRLTLLGWKPKQIADFLGITEPTVCNAVNGHKGRMQLAIMRGARDADSIDIAKDITEFAAEAWEIAKDLIRDTNQPASLRLKYCFETIGVAGHVKPQRVQMSHAVAHLTIDEITAIKDRARLLANETGIVDAEYIMVAEPKGRLSESNSDLDTRETNCRLSNNDDNHKRHQGSNGGQISDQAEPT